MITPLWAARRYKRWALSQCYQYCRLKSRSRVQLAAVKQSLQQYTFTHAPKITITLSSRRLGHRDSFMPRLLQSILANTHDLMAIELLIWVDDDDDLFFYRQLKEQYQARLPLRFVIGARGKGYGDLMRFNTELYRLRSASAILWLGVSEDAVFTLNAWDVEILRIFTEADRCQYIGAQISFASTIEKRGPFHNYPTPIYQYGVEPYPIARIALLELIEQAIAHYDGWTPLGRVVGTDAFLADMLRHMWTRHKVNMHVQLPPFIKQYGGKAWNNPKRIDIHYRAVNRFMSEEIQRMHGEIVDFLFDNGLFSNGSSSNGAFSNGTVNSGERQATTPDTPERT